MKKRKKDNPKKLGKMLSKGKSPDEILKSKKNDYSVNQVVEKIENPELKAKVATKYLNRIIKENDVRNVLTELPEENILWILDNNSEILAQNGKLGYALQAIPDNEVKMDKLAKSTHLLMDLEVRDVLLSLNLKQDEKTKEKFEKQKIQIIANKIFENVKQFGTTMHLREMLRCLQEKSQKDLLTVCLQILNTKESDFIKDIKLHVVRDFKLIDPNLDINQYVDKKLLTQKEANSIKEDVETVLYKKAYRKAK